MGELIILLGAGMIAITLSAPLTDLTTAGETNRVKETASAEGNTREADTTSLGPESVNIGDLPMTDYMNDQQLQALIKRRYGFQIFKDCKQYNATWKCIVDCKKSGFLTVRMDKMCKCLCYHPMPKTSTKNTAGTTEATKSTPKSTNFWEGLKMPTFVGPIWAFTSKPHALASSPTMSTTKEPCVDVGTKTTAAKAPENQAKNNGQPENKDQTEDKDHTENKDQPENKDRPENKDQTENTDRPENKDQSKNKDRPENKDQPENKDRPENKDQTGKKYQPENKDRPENKDQTEKKYQPENKDRPENKDQTEKKYQPENEDRPENKDQKGKPPS